MSNKKTKKSDKYGVCLDSDEYLNRASVASVNDHTGFVPAAMENEGNKESYEAMFNVPTGYIDGRIQKRKNTEVKTK